MLKFIDSINLRTAIIWTIIITLLIDIISRFTENAIPTIATNGLFLLIVNFCFYFILLKKTLKNSDKEQKLKFTLLIGSALLLISQFIILYDIYGVIHSSWGMFVSAAPAEKWGEYMYNVTYPKTILFSVLGGGLIIYFFYLLSKYTYPELKFAIRFLGIWSIVCNWITSTIITTVIVLLSIDDTSIDIETIIKYNINIFQYIALFLLYNKADKITYELKDKPESLNKEIEG